MITGAWVLVVFLTGGLITSFILVIKAWGETSGYKSANEELADRVQELEVANLQLEWERNMNNRHLRLAEGEVMRRSTFSETDILRELGELN